MNHTIRFRKYAGGPVHSIKVRGELSEILQGMRTRYKTIDIIRVHSPIGRVVPRTKRKTESTSQGKPLFETALFP